MIRLIRLSFFIISGFVGTALLTAGLMLVLIEPDRYRADIEQVVHRHTGLRLQIAGNINWTFRPMFGVTIDDVRLSNPAARQELASFPQLSVSLAPGHLLRGELVIGDLVAREPHLNWFVTPKGDSNWLTGLSAPEAPAHSGTDARTVRLDIRRIDVSNASLAFRDLGRGIDRRLQNVNLRSDNMNLDGHPFPLAVDARLRDHVRQTDLPIGLHATARGDADGSTIRLDQLRFLISPMVLEGNLTIRDLHSDPHWDGTLTSHPFNLAYLLETVAGHDAGPDLVPDANRVSLRAEFNGDARGATISHLAIDAGGQRLALRGDVLFARTDQPLIAALQATELHDGILAARIRFDNMADPARMDSRVLAENVDADALSGLLPPLRPFTGRLNLTAAHSATGNTVNGLMDSITGITQLSMSGGTADISLIRRALTAIAALNPENDAADDWPDQLDFSELEGQWRLTGGLSSGQELSLRMDNFALDGRGGMGLDRQRIDYRFDVTIPVEPARGEHD